MASSLNDHSKSAQRSPRSLSDLSMIIQWSSQSPWSPRSFDSVQSNLSMIAKESDLSTNAQWTLNECSTNAQWALNDLINLPMISQRSFNERTKCPPRRRDGWEINECTRISQRNGFFIAFERLLKDQANFVSLNGYPTISVRCKGPFISAQSWGSGREWGGNDSD